MKYILVSFPEIQDFMDHKRWSECIFCTEIEGHPCPDSTYAVPEDLYEEVTLSLMYPATIETNLGRMVVNADSIHLNDKVYNRDIHDLKKGSEVIMYSDNKGYWITKCLANPIGLVPLFEDGSTLLNSFIEGVYND